MRLLLVTRLYSHLEPMLDESDWRPQGMPAICKLIEGLARRKISTDVLLVAKQMFEDRNEPFSRTFPQLPGIVFHVAPLAVPLGGRLAQIRNAWRQYGFAWSILRRGRHDVVYCDRAHLVFGATLAWLGKKVVLRLHGLAGLPETTAFLEKRRLPSLRLQSLHAPFSYILGTREGSDYASFVKHRFSPKVPFTLLLNGVDKVATTPDRIETLRHELGFSPGIPVIAMTGRMDPDKNPLVLLEAMQRLHLEKHNFYGLFVGGGTQIEELRQRAKDFGMDEKVRILGQIEHARMPDFLAIADIYVSLNACGNLSNVVLEAMRAGRCIITFAPCRKTGRDEQNACAPFRDMQVLIDRDDMAAQLPAALARLLRNPEEIREKETRMKAWAEKNLQTWEDRIDWEIDLLARIADGASGIPTCDSYHPLQSQENER